MNHEKDLQTLSAEIRECTKCSLTKTRLNAVPGEGSSTARVMFVGEAPGAREDESGRPFVGRSGDLLTELITEIGLSRDDVFITSILKSRPPDNRTPRRNEIEACLPHLFRQLELINPKYVVLLGGVAISSLIGPWKLSDAHGKFCDSDGRTFFMTYHPAAALRFPKTKDVMRKDLQILKRELG
jgi:DNA polymerase